MSKAIVCMNYQENPIPGCMYAVHQNGRVIASGQTDGEGRATITETISSCILVIVATRLIQLNGEVY